MTRRPERDGKVPLTELAEMVGREERIVMVTAYDYPSGRLADAAGMDIVLVGDSAAMTVLGHTTTVPATMDEMLMLTRAVTRGAQRPLVVADMPFGSFQVSDEEAVRNGIRFVKEAGADAVKLEGAGPSLSLVLALVGAGIPVMGHIGLTPQSATMLGGFKAQGRTAAKAAQLVDDARALEAAGCFSIVLEAVPAPVAAEITRRLLIPTIGIGAGVETDGQGAADGAIRAHEHRGEGRLDLIGLGHLAVLLEEEAGQSVFAGPGAVGLGTAAADDGDVERRGVLALPAGDVRQERSAGAAAGVHED